MKHTDHPVSFESNTEKDDEGKGQFRKYVWEKS